MDILHLDEYVMNDCNLLFFMLISMHCFLLFLFQLTWADIFFVGILDYLNFILGSDLTENHSNLKKLIENVSSVDSIAAWLESRPNSEL